MTPKSIIVTLFASLGLLAIAGGADAQSLGTWSQTAPGSTEAVGVPMPELVTGYNFFHASNCVISIDNVVCIVPIEGGVVCTTVPGMQNAMTAACQTGNILAIFVPNPATGVFTSIVTFLSK